MYLIGFIKSMFEEGFYSYKSVWCCGMKECSGKESPLAAILESGARHYHYQILAVYIPTKEEW